MAPNIDVLIVTATRVESLAVMAACEKATQRQAAPASFAGRIYQDLGEINHSRVLLLQTEVGSSGLGASQQAVQEAIAALHPHAVIMIGIAFGVDESKQVIGEILVSEQLLLYDLQRVGTDEKGGERIVTRGDKPHASVRLLNYLRSAHNYWDGPTVTFGLVLSGAKLVDNVDSGSNCAVLRQRQSVVRWKAPGCTSPAREATGIGSWSRLFVIGLMAISRQTRLAGIEAARNSAEFVLFALQHAQLPTLDKQQAVPSVTDPASDAAALAPPRLTIREASAAEILVNLKGVTLSHEFAEKVENLYVGRWTREPGWQARVHDLPTKLKQGDWYCTLTEIGTGTLVFATTNGDVSSLRPGDLVTVSGRIGRVSQLEYIGLEEAIVREVRLP